MPKRLLGSGRSLMYISPECLEWGRHNGLSNEADGTERLYKEYRHWQEENGHLRNVMYRSPETLEKQIAKAEKLLALYKQAIEIKSGRTNY